jgi:hypothetical protein
MVARPVRLTRAEQQRGITSFREALNDPKLERQRRSFSLTDFTQAICEMIAVAFLIQWGRKLQNKPAF